MSSEFRKEMSEALKKINAMHTILTGNGYPENGLVFKVAQHKKVIDVIDSEQVILKVQKHHGFVRFWERFGWMVLIALAGIPSTVMAAVIINMINLK